MLELYRSSVESIQRDSRFRSEREVKDSELWLRSEVEFLHDLKRCSYSSSSVSTRWWDSPPRPPRKVEN